MRIGIIGVGPMSHGTARNVLRGGRSLAMADHPGVLSVDDLIRMGDRKRCPPARGRRR